MQKELLEKSNYLVSSILHKLSTYKNGFISIFFFIEFFDHENIVGLVDVQKPPSQVGYEDIYIITDLMETDMHRVIYSRQDLTDDHCQYFMY